MQNKKLLPYIIVSISAVVLVLAMAFGAVVGAFILGPYLPGEARAAAWPQSIQLEPPATLQTADTNLVAAYEQAMIDLYQKSLPAVVNIRVTQKIDRSLNNEHPFQFFGPFGSTPFDRLPLPQTPEEFYNQGQGSGFVWDDEGHIVTNYHVVENASRVEVVFADDTIVEAEVLGVDPDADLAVLQVDLPANALKPATLGDSDTLQVGQVVVAIGNPFGQEFTMTSGIVSAVGRTIRSGNSPFSIPQVIQTDAAINPGNSGGPLLNRHGEVIGINSQIISRSGANAGVGFAIPINIAKQIVPTLIAGEKFEYAWLGITGVTLTSEVADFMKLSAETRGVLVIDVTQDSPADEANLQGSDKTLKVEGAEYQLGGDVIVGINSQPVKNMDDLITYLIEETRPGDEVTLDVIRPNGKQETITVTLAARPNFNSVSQENK